MFKCFNENELISPNQSGFKPGDSSINQLLAITHEINKSSDDGFEVRVAFLDISTTFEKFWHQGLIFKLRQKFQRRSCPGFHTWSFIVFNISEELSSRAKLFADDTSLFSVIHDSNTSGGELNSDLAKINRWTFQLKMIFNPDPKNKHRESFSVGNLKQYRIPI